MRASIYFIIIITLIACKKQGEKKEVTIEGRILESTSKPVPVADYSIYFSQLPNSGFLGGVDGLDYTTKTAADGRFKFQYNPSKNFGLSFSGSNPNSINIYGIDSSQYQLIGARWYPVSSGLNTNLNTIYLYKNIQTLIRKVQFNNNLNVGETLEVISPDSSGSSRGIIRGPVLAGTVIRVDTIRNCKLSMYNVTTKEYHFTITITKPGYLSFLNIPIPQGDELFREVIINY